MRRRTRFEFEFLKNKIAILFYNEMMIRIPPDRHQIMKLVSHLFLSLWMYNVEDSLLSFKGRLSWKNLNKYSKFNMTISMSCQGHKSCKVLKKSYGYACYLNISLGHPSSHPMSNSFFG